jgi:hypothetical protein
LYREKFFFAIGVLKLYPYPFTQVLKVVYACHSVK